MIMKYTSNISDIKWLTLGLLSDVGWIAYFVGFALYMLSGADGLGTLVLSVTFLLNCLCVLAVAVGIIEIISQRIRRLKRTIGKGDLVCGFGFVVFGSLAGFLLTGVSAVIDILLKYETGMCFVSQIIMAVGALVCFAFGLPIMRSFRKDN